MTQIAISLVAFSLSMCYSPYHDLWFAYKIFITAYQVIKHRTLMRLQKYNIKFVSQLI